MRNNSKSTTTGCLPVYGNKELYLTCKNNELKVDFAYTHRVGLDHVGIPSVSAYANIIITKVSLGTSTIDVAVFGRADKESHILFKRDEKKEK
jgi:hypothetical protein